VSTRAVHLSDAPHTLGTPEGTWGVQRILKFVPGTENHFKGFLTSFFKNWDGGVESRVVVVAVGWRQVPVLVPGATDDNTG
jgi:hypothetical protein